MLVEVIIRAEDDASQHGIDTLSTKVSERGLQQSGSIYHNSKREDVGWLVKFGLEMCLRTAPIVIASQQALNAPAFVLVSGIFKISNLNLFNYRLFASKAEVGNDIIWFDI